MTRLRVRPGKPLRGRVRVPGDAQIGAQALVWAALAEGRSQLRGLGDVGALRRALGELGVAIRDVEGGLEIDGVGLRGLKMPGGALDAGDSEIALSLLTSLLAAQPFGTRVLARGQAATHPLRTLIEPLRARGAHVAGRDEDMHAPVAVAPLLPDELLQGAEILIPTGDATTKLGLLVSGLFTRGVTAISEGMLSRDHVERALVALGAPVSTAAGMTLLDTSDRVPAWPGFSWSMPGDFTSASYLLAAGLIVPGSEVEVDAVGLNPTRTAWLEALRGTGARTAQRAKGDCAGNEPLGDLKVWASRLTRVRVGGERALGLLDEVPALAALALASADRISIRDVGALRGRKPDALKGLRELLARFEIGCTLYEDGIELDPVERARGAHLSAELSPELTLLGVVLGLAAEGETVLEDTRGLDARYPGVLSALSALGADLAREGEA